MTDGADETWPGFVSERPCANWSGGQDGDPRR